MSHFPSCLCRNLNQLQYFESPLGKKTKKNSQSCKIGPAVSSSYYTAIICTVSVCLFFFTVLKSSPYGYCQLLARHANPRILCCFYDGVKKKTFFFFYMKQLPCEGGLAARWTPQWHRARRAGLAGSHPFHVPFSTGPLSPRRCEKHTAQRHRSAQLNNTRSNLEAVKCEQTDDKTATDGSTEERRAAHSTQLATCCRVTLMGYAALA